EDGAGRRRAVPGQFTGVALDADAPGARVAQRGGEEAGAAADVRDDPAVEVRVPAELGDRVGGEQPVEPLRVGLLLAERAQQAYRARERRTVRTGRQKGPPGG